MKKFHHVLSVVCVVSLLCNLLGASTVTKAFTNFSTTNQEETSQTLQPVRPTVRATTTIAQQLTGTAEPNIEIRVLVNEQLFAKGNADITGAFAIVLDRPLRIGETVAVVAVSKEGVMSERVQVTVKYVPVLAPPSVEVVTNNTTVIRGRTEPGWRVIVRYGKNKQAVGVASATGNYAVRIPKQKENTLVHVAAISTGGNTSKYRAMVVVDAIAPIAKWKRTSKILTVTTEPYAEIQLFVDKKRFARGETDDKGIFTYVLPKKSEKKDVTLIVSDMSKNERSYVIK
ncbi:MAG: Ig-like domain-containing protein [Bacilli bacterium]